jgi:hypothetical protein
MYKEYRDTTLNGAVDQMYSEMASRHRVRFPCIQVRPRGSASSSSSSASSSGSHGNFSSCVCMQGALEAECSRCVPSEYMWQQLHS